MSDEAKRDDGGWAFPRSATEYDRGETGMTLRDWFAGQALTGFMAHPCNAVMPDGAGGSPSHTAKSAYEVADAMLAERRR